MPVVGGSTPSVAIQVPVPTPVQPKPKAPKPVVPQAGQPSQDEQEAQPQFTPPPPKRDNWHAVILPWTPSAQKMSRFRMGRRRIPDHQADAFLNSIWKQWQTWRKHIADNERRGKRDLYEGAPPIMDDTARLVFADLLGEKGDPREPVVRGHVDREIHQHGDEPRTHFQSSIRNFGKHPESLYKNQALWWHNAIATDRPPPPQHELGAASSWDFDRDLIHPGQTQEKDRTPDYHYSYNHLPSVVWRHKGVTTSRSSSGGGRFREHPVMFHAPVTFEQYFKIADTMPAAKRKHWENYAAFRGWKRPAAPAAEQMRRLPRRVVRYAMKKPTMLTGPEYLLPTEVSELGKTRVSGLKTINANIRQGMANRKGILPGFEELTSLAQLGSPAKGSYENQHATIGSLLDKDQHDNDRWATLNSILSANSGFEVHTRDALQGMANWIANGRPGDRGSLERVFGKVNDVQATDDKGRPIFKKDGSPKTDRLWTPGTGMWKGTGSVWGEKIDKIVDFLSHERQSEYKGGVHWGDISKGAFKTPNFGISFVDPKGTALDTHMARLLTPGRPFHESALHQMAIGLGSPELYRDIKATRDNLVENKTTYLAYKTLVAHAANELGWEPRHVQEAVWTAIMGITALRYIDPAGMKVTKANKIIDRLTPNAIASGWDFTAMFNDKSVTDSLERLNIDPRRIKDVLNQSQQRKRVSVKEKVPVGNRAALESAARRIGAADLKTAAAVPIIEHLTGKTAEELAAAGRSRSRKQRRRIVVKRYGRPTAEDHAPFHRAILADIDTSRNADQGGDRIYTHKDGTSSLVYADYLEEHGFHHMADFVRKAANATSGADGGYGDVTRIMRYGPREPDKMPQPLSVFLYQGNEKRTRRGRGFTRTPMLQISVQSPGPDGNGHILGFNSGDMPKEHAEQLVKNLMAEGHPAGNESAAQRAPKPPTAPPTV